MRKPIERPGRLARSNLMSTFIPCPEAYYTAQTLEARHRALNEHAPPDRLVLHDGLEIGIAPNAHLPALAFCHDAIMSRELDQFLVAAQDKRRLLDIGSLHGIFSLAFTARAGTSALAIEPSPAAIEGLRENCQRNSGHDIRIVDVAAGASEGTVAMRYEWLHLQALAVGETPADGVHHVRMQSVDVIVADQRFRPDIVKIDVEGYELEVLRGMTRTIQCFRPELHVEIHGPWLAKLGASFGDVLRLLWSLGYKVTLLDGYAPGHRETDFDYFSDHITHARCVHEFSAWERRVDGMEA
jgi:FkbM family methyltransferase